MATQAAYVPREGASAHVRGARERYGAAVPPTFHHTRLRDADPELLYRVLRLRVQVFVVEQECAYEDLDGRDLEPGTELHWVADDDDPTRVLATLRVLRDPDGAMRIGRVVTDPAARSLGVASTLMARAVERCAELSPTADVVLDAQAHLADWYARFGFVVDGPGFLEDGIPHVPMRRSASSGTVR
ncbi:GNAT family N-acetyltransferase [Actinotalea sp. M2MS4P-6]|uniref:GNAT family N-acetyltransferase n=1 Tax=Actinotalea sp. M2MS4P-6 TaxID=2983762 RepID=UPI0021E41D9F|nr:GNAT family N-acetyltransferase [Actinotalea sp. M2MS4P-6]MCV2392872.1 GNAT family N-acetyltransferase [Actinotalea sp. M2MS4P-6]